MIAYLFKTILVAALFSGVYFLFLEREKMHRFNRFYLLISLVLSFVIPVITIQTHSQMAAAVNQINISSATPEIFSSPVIQQTSLPQKDALHPLVYVLILYGVVTAFFMFRFFKNIFNLLSQTKRHTKILYGKATLVLMEKETEPHSFLRYIFLNKTGFESGAIAAEILQHELAHVQQKHSLDIIFMELLTAVLWFHPFIFLYKKAVQLNHEFLADDAAIKSNTDIRNYQLLLLQKASGRSLAMTHSFNYFIAKKRLIMLTKTTSRITAACKQTVALAFLLLSVFLFAKQSVAQDTTRASSEKNESNQTAVPASQDTAQKTRKPNGFIWGNTIGSTKEGASDELMNEYKTLVNKYLETDTNGNKNINRTIEPADRKRMETIAKQMNKEQQSKQEVMFVKPFPPNKKTVPTQKQLEAFKNASVYGIWIDGKRKPNAVLNNFLNTDFSYFTVSKLYGAAKKGRSYSYQVDMMTNDYYQKDYDEAMSHKDESILVIVQLFSKDRTVIRHTAL